MSSSTRPSPKPWDRRPGLVQALLERRSRANEGFFAVEAERIARLCHQMAERFASGGRLLAIGTDAQARSDARHVAVEFVHPVIVGKRALPALALSSDGVPLARQVELHAEVTDILIAFGGPLDGVGVAVRTARNRGCLTIAFHPRSEAEWEFQPPTTDPFVGQELVETLYHILWELVHVFFEHRGLLAGRSPGPSHDAGAASFLYPFLAQAEHDLKRVVAEVRCSVTSKAAEIGGLREQTLTENRHGLLQAAEALRHAFDRGGKLLVMGNGGSATDAMDLAADLRSPPGDWPQRPCIDLTEDPAILTAIANDIGPEAIFARQIIAYLRPHDVVLALSTSGGSANVLEGLAEARRRGAGTIALVGYDGGRIAGERLADLVLITRSQHIPRIQEAQASACHVLRALIEEDAVEASP